MADNNTINCATMMYYNLTPNEGVTVHYVIEMKDEVDGNALRHAVDTAMKRYPYLGKRIVASAEGYSLEDNDLPVIVKNTHHAIPLCGPDANYHQFTFTYAGNTIYLNNTHALVDGRGRSPFLHTVMYYYCQERYNEEVLMDGVNLVDSAIDPREYYDPFNEAIPETDLDLTAALPAPRMAMSLAEMGLVHPSPSHTQMHHISIDEKQLMAKCKQNDASPNSAICVILARAIAKLHPDCPDPILANVGMDPRAALNAELSHKPLATSTSIEFSPEMREMSFEEQNTIFRAELYLRSEASNLIRGAQATKKLMADINALPTLEQKLAAAQQIMEMAVKTRTFSVSYSGKSCFGSCDSHIAALFPQLYIKNIGLAIEITATNGKFYLTISQGWREDVYFNAFLKELTALGLDYDLLYSAQLEPIAIDIRSNN